MTSVKLPSSQPLALAKNALLQKFLEVQKAHLELDHRIERRNITKVSEQCVTTAYQLLLEAEEIEKKRLESQPQGMGSLRPPNTQKPTLRRKSSVAIKIRPVTAGGQIGQVATVKGESTANRRPLSAYPVLEKSVSLMETQQEDGADDVFDGPTEVPEKRSVSPENGERSRSTTCSTLEDVVTCVNSGPPKLVVPSATPPRAKSLAVEDRNAIIAKLKQRSNDISAKKSNQRKSSNMDNVQVANKPVKKPSADVEFEAEFPCLQKQQNTCQSQRPKTATNFRKKPQIDERAEYWNTRVQNLIRKWDTIDKPSRHQYDNETNVLILLPPEPPPQKNLPKHLQQPTTNAEAKTRTFIKNYGGQYRSLIRPQSAPSVTLSSKKRSAKITRQELTSIKAEFSRQRKQTNALLKKSKKLINQIQGLVDASNKFDL